MYYNYIGDYKGIVLVVKQASVLPSWSTHKDFQGNTRTLTNWGAKELN